MPGVAVILTACIYPKRMRGSRFRSSGLEERRDSRSFGIILIMIGLLILIFA